MFCLLTLFDSLRKLPNGLHRGQVEVTRVNVRIQGLPSDFLRGCLALLHVPTSHNDTTPWGCQNGKRKSVTLRAKITAEDLVHFVFFAPNQRHVFSTPLLASSWAVHFPMPVLAPVITTVFPLMVALLGHRPPVTRFLWGELKFSPIFFKHPISAFKPIGDFSQSTAKHFWSVSLLLGSDCTEIRLFLPCATNSFQMDKAGHCNTTSELQGPQKSSRLTVCELVCANLIKKWFHLFGNMQQLITISTDNKGLS